MRRVDMEAMDRAADARTGGPAFGARRPRAVREGPVLYQLRRTRRVDAPAMLRPRRPTDRYYRTSASRWGTAGWVFSALHSSSAPVILTSLSGTRSAMVPLRSQTSGPHI